MHLKYGNMYEFKAKLFILCNSNSLTVNLFSFSVCLSTGA